MVTDGNKTYCGGHFAIYTSIESLCCTPEANIMLYLNHTSILKKRHHTKTDWKLCVYGSGPLAL